MLVWFGEVIAMKSVFTPIVMRALEGCISDLGFSKAERLELKRAVRWGVLSQGTGGPFPILKTCYARPGFDFAADRANEIADMRVWQEMDRLNGTDRFFPAAAFQGAE